jgi:DNA adenine methylase
LSDVDRTARFIYLNRYCFNGVYRTNRQGEFNVPRGRDTGDLPTLDTIKQCARALDSAELVSGDFEVILERARRGDFVYLDPPYTKADQPYSGEYGYGAFSSTDFERLLAQLKRLDDLGATFLLSYRYSLQINRGLRHWHTSVVSVRRHIAGFSSARRVVRELLVSNHPIGGH